jgi:hypothetical protein
VNVETKRAVKAVDGHTFTKLAKEVQTNVCLPESWWQL